MAPAEPTVTSRLITAVHVLIPRNGRSSHSPLLALRSQRPPRSQRLRSRRPSRRLCDGFVLRQDPAQCVCRARWDPVGLDRLDKQVKERACLLVSQLELNRSPAAPGGSRGGDLGSSIKSSLRSLLVTRRNSPDKVSVLHAQHAAWSTACRFDSQHPDHDITKLTALQRPQFAQDRRGRWPSRADRTMATIRTGAPTADGVQSAIALCATVPLTVGEQLVVTRRPIRSASCGG
jgi:hypothetical protein